MHSSFRPTCDTIDAPRTTTSTNRKSIAYSDGRSDPRAEQSFPFQNPPAPKRKRHKSDLFLFSSFFPGKLDPIWAEEEVYTICASRRVNKSLFILTSGPN